MRSATASSAADTLLEVASPTVLNNRLSLLLLGLRLVGCFGQLAGSAVWRLFVGPHDPFLSVRRTGTNNPAASGAHFWGGRSHHRSDNSRAHRLQPLSVDGWRCALSESGVDSSVSNRPRLDIRPGSAACQSRRSSRCSSIEHGCLPAMSDGAHLRVLDSDRRVRILATI